MVRNGSFLPKIFILIIFTVDMAMAQLPRPQNQTSKRLRIVVPVKDGFTEFLNIKPDPTTGEPTYGGFSIDIFKAVVNSAMPYTISFDFIPFAKPDGTMNGSYDDMLNSVFSQNYDAAVGDISIRYYRTQWVDFTLPYSETGVSMLVPLQRHKTTGGGQTFPTELAIGLVSAAAASCFIMALLFWFKEYRNDTAQLAGNGGERATIRTRLLMVLCFLVLVVLTACFTAILITSLTTQRSTPPTATIDDFARRGQNVGYQTGSFVKNLLSQRGFSESQLKKYSSAEQMLDLLSKGTARGGVDAVIDETPYLKLFLTQHCNAYTLVPSATLQGDGFGFAFQKESPLVRDISTAILKVTNSDQLSKIQDRTIGDLETCLVEHNTDVNLINWPNALRILIVGAVGVLALMFIFFLVYFGSNDRAGSGTSGRIAYPCYFCWPQRPQPTNPARAEPSHRGD